MAQLLIRKFDDHLKARLRKRAARRGVSMEQEARSILQDALLRENNEEFGLGTRIAALFEDIDWEADELQPFPSSELKPAAFD